MARLEGEYLKVIERGDSNQVRRDAGAVYLGKYGIPAHMWKTWAAAAGLPGARWEDKSAQIRVASWAARTLYSEFKDWGLVAVGWRYGAGMARTFRNAYGTRPDPQIVQRVMGKDGASFVDRVTQNMDSLAEKYATDGPPPASVPQGRAGSIELKFTEEEDTEGILEPEPEPERTPAQLALINVLGAMADRTAGGKRLEVEQIEIAEVPANSEEMAPPIGVSPAEDPEEVIRG